MKRDMCATCPWREGNTRNRWWMVAWKKLTSVGVLKKGVHRCHEMSNDLCGTPDADNVCVGSAGRIKAQCD